MINDDSIRRLLGCLPLVPTQDGRWSQPTNTYRRTEELVKVLGEARHLWLDASRLPSTRSVQTFIDSLGIRLVPYCAASCGPDAHPGGEVRAIGGGKACERRGLLRALRQLRGVEGQGVLRRRNHGPARCSLLPGRRRFGRLHTADSLYAPYRSDAFRSQAKILDFRNTARVKPELLEELGVSINPETRLVISHLQQCVATGMPPHVSVYQVFSNERAQRDDSLVASLAGARCIYVENAKAFVRPNQLLAGRHSSRTVRLHHSWKPRIVQASLHRDRSKERSRRPRFRGHPVGHSRGVLRAIESGHRTRPLCLRPMLGGAVHRGFARCAYGK